MREHDTNFFTQTVIVTRATPHSAHKRRLTLSEILTQATPYEDDRERTCLELARASRDVQSALTVQARPLGLDSVRHPLVDIHANLHTRADSIGVPVDHCPVKARATPPGREKGGRIVVFGTDEVFHGRVWALRREFGGLPLQIG